MQLFLLLRLISIFLWAKFIYNKQIRRGKLIATDSIPLAPSIISDKYFAINNIFKEPFVRFRRNQIFVDSGIIKMQHAVGMQYCVPTAHIVLLITLYQHLVPTGQQIPYNNSNK